MPLRFLAIHALTLDELVARLNERNLDLRAWSVVPNGAGWSSIIGVDAPEVEQDVQDVQD